jgi:hypothetical protein
MLTSNQRGRGNDPVVVLGKIKSAVAVNIAFARNILSEGAHRSGLFSCSDSKNLLCVQAAQPKILFERSRDDRVGTVSQFYDNGRIESLFSQVSGNSAVINVTVFKVLQP